jgi:hypothetical protein
MCDKITDVSANPVLSDRKALFYPLIRTAKSAGLIGKTSDIVVSTRGGRRVFDPGTQDGVIRLLLIGLPVAVLATLIFLLSLRKSAKPVPKVHPALKVFDDGPLHAEAALSQAAAEGPVALVDETAAGRLNEQIASATALGSKDKLAPLYLQLASVHERSGNAAGALAALRSAAGIAAQHGPKAAHAEARLQLAEAAYLSGDLTSACEHWQLARGAFQDDGQKDAHAKIEKRMRDHGCPTDWVLTDF